MKLKGFSNLAINLGYFDIRPAKADQLNLVTCETCGFTAKTMLYCECNHIFCWDCLLLLDKFDDECEVIGARCILCKCDSSAMRIAIDESFIAKLQCHCPQCATVIRLEEFKGHLKVCNSIAVVQDAPVISTGENSSSEQSSDSNAAIAASAVATPMGDTTRANTDNGSLMAISTARRELIEMLSTTKDDLRNEFTDKIMAIEEHSNQQAMAAEERGTFHLMLKRVSHINHSLGGGSQADKYQTSCIHFGGRTFRFSYKCVKDAPLFSYGAYVNTVGVSGSLYMTVVASGGHHQENISCVHVSNSEFDVRKEGFTRTKNLTAHDLTVGQSVVITDGWSSEVSDGTIFKVVFELRKS